MSGPGYRPPFPARFHPGQHGHQGEGKGLELSAGPRKISQFSPLFGLDSYDDLCRSGPDRAPGLVRRVQLEHLRQRQDGRQLYRRDREGGHEAARRAAG